MVASPLPLREGLVTSIAALYALQELDLSIAAARTGIADAEARLGEPEELEEARKQAEEAREAAREAEHALKEREFEADELRKKIEPLEQKLYKGTLVNPKELQDLQLDIDSLKRRRSELEDRALEAMETLEQAQQALAEAENELQQITDTTQAEHGELRDRGQQLEAEIAGLERRRAEQAAGIEAGLLRLYDRLIESRQGRAVAKVEGGACQGCRISLPMNLIQRARAGTDIVQCSSCERILYVS